MVLLARYEFQVQDIQICQKILWRDEKTLIQAVCSCQYCRVMGHSESTHLNGFKAQSTSSMHLRSFMGACVCVCAVNCILFSDGPVLTCQGIMPTMLCTKSEFVNCCKLAKRTFPYQPICLTLHDGQWNQAVGSWDVTLFHDKLTGQPSSSCQAFLGSLVSTS